MLNVSDTESEQASSSLNVWSQQILQGGPRESPCSVCTGLSATCVLSLECFDDSAFPEQHQAHIPLPAPKVTPPPGLSLCPAEGEIPDLTR